MVFEENIGPFRFCRTAYATCVGGNFLL